MIYGEKPTPHTKHFSMGIRGRNLHWGHQSPQWPPLQPVPGPPTEAADHPVDLRPEGALSGRGQAVLSPFCSSPAQPPKENRKDSGGLCQGQPRAQAGG